MEDDLCDTPMALCAARRGRARARPRHLGPSVTTGGAAMADQQLRPTVRSGIAATAPHRGPVDRAQGRVPKIVPGRYIVKLKDGTATPSATARHREGADEGQRRHRAEGLHRRRCAVTPPQLTAAEAKRLAADPDVAYVRAGPQRTRASGTQIESRRPGGWTASTRPPPRLNGSYTYPGASASGVTAYIIDTGINVAHQDFGGRASDGFDAFVGDGRATTATATARTWRAPWAAATTASPRMSSSSRVRVLDCDGTRDHRERRRRDRLGDRERPEARRGES